MRQVLGAYNGGMYHLYCDKGISSGSVLVTGELRLYFWSQDGSSSPLSPVDILLHIDI